MPTALPAERGEGDSELWVALAGHRAATWQRPHVTPSGRREDRGVSVRLCSREGSEIRQQGQIRSVRGSRADRKPSASVCEQGPWRVEAARALRASLRRGGDGKQEAVGSAGLLTQAVLSLRAG